MNWKALIKREWIQEFDGAMQVHAQIGDVDVPVAERSVHEWQHTYSREWLEARPSGDQVRVDVTADLSAYAQSCASAGARIDYIKSLIPEDGLILDLDVSL